MQTFDAVDGKQARRTNSSSPLGELFDHGTCSSPFSFTYLCVIFSLKVLPARATMILIKFLLWF